MSSAAGGADTATKGKGSASPPRTGTKGVPRAIREQQLLDAAERAFAGRAYGAVSMDAVAAEGGVTKPMIYAYFGSKEGLFISCVQRAYDRGIERVEAAAALEGSPEERAWRVLDAVFGWVDEYREQWPLVFGTQVPGGRIAEEAASSRAGMVAVIARVMREWIPDAKAAEEFEPMAEAIVGATSALADRWLRHPEEPRELQTLRALRIAGPALAALAEPG